MTTQQSGYIGPRDAERSRALVKFLAKAAFRGEPLFRSSRPDSIETDGGHAWDVPAVRLFRSSRPDSIETVGSDGDEWDGCGHCSGLLGRTPLRRYRRPLGGYRTCRIVSVF